MKCFYEFSEEKIDKVDIAVSGMTKKYFENWVLSKYSLNQITCDILKELQDMFYKFELKEGYYKFNLHNGEVVLFKYSFS